MEQIQGKLMTNIFFKFKNPIFGPFPQFLAQKKFPKKSSSVTHNLTKVSSTMPKSRETYWSSSKKTPQQPAGCKGRQTPFHRTFPATAKSPTSTTAINLHLKVKDIDFDGILTKCNVSQPACKKSNQLKLSFLINF